MRLLLDLPTHQVLPQGLCLCGCFLCLDNGFFSFQFWIKHHVLLRPGLASLWLQWPRPLCLISLSFHFLHKPHDFLNTHYVFACVFMVFPGPIQCLCLLYTGRIKGQAQRGVEPHLGHPTSGVKTCPVPTLPTGVLCDLRSHYPDGLAARSL